MTTMANLSDEAILAAARELIARRGLAARDEATARMAELERQGNWPEHALASRILTAVERLLAPEAV